MSTTQPPTEKQLCQDVSETGQECQQRTVWYTVTSVDNTATNRKTAVSRCVRNRTGVPTENSLVHGDKCQQHSHQQKNSCVKMCQKPDRSANREQSGTRRQVSTTQPPTEKQLCQDVSETGQECQQRTVWYTVTSVNNTATNRKTAVSRCVRNRTGVPTENSLVHGDKCRQHSHQQKNSCVKMCQKPERSANREQSGTR